jgi:hypothetical protein
MDGKVRCARGGEKYSKGIVADHLFAQRQQVLVECELGAQGGANAEQIYGRLFTQHLTGAFVFST